MIELTETLDKAPIQGCRRITAVDSRIDRVHTMGLRSARCESTRDPDTTEGFSRDGRYADHTAHARRDRHRDSNRFQQSDGPLDRQPPTRS